MHGIIEEIEKQIQDFELGNFRCDSCINYEGSLKCIKGIFIAFEGANLIHCSYYQPGKKCTHCGKIIVP